MTINKKNLFYFLLVLSLFILLNLLKIQNVLATDAVVQTIRNGDVLDATPVNNNDQNLASVINGKLDSNNIIDGSLKAIDFENNINLNSKLLTGSIGFDKASTDWFNANYPVYKNTGLNAIDLRISSRLLNSAGTLDLSGNAITGYYLSNTLFDTGLSFNQPDSKVYVKVDAAYNTYDVADSIYGTITFNDTKQLTLQASVSLDGGTTYLQPNIAISANANDSLQTTNKLSIVSAINEVYNNSKTNYIPLGNTFERTFTCLNGDYNWDTTTFYGFITRENEYNKLVNNDTFQSTIISIDTNIMYNASNRKLLTNIYSDTLYIFNLTQIHGTLTYYLSVNDSLVYSGSHKNFEEYYGQINIKNLFKLYNKTTPDKWTLSYWWDSANTPNILICFKNAMVALKE
jgi:hypothetical protein